MATQTKASTRSSKAPAKRTVGTPVKKPEEAFTPLADGSVVWDQILTECGTYRDGFVSVFRKWEGKPTDEKDAQGRTVKVNIASFARHVGIPEQTFRQWVKGTKQVVQPVDRERLDQVTEQTEPVVTEMPFEGTTVEQPEPSGNGGSETTEPAKKRDTPALQKNPPLKKSPAKRTTRITSVPATWYASLDAMAEWVEQYGRSYTEDEIRNLDGLVQKLADALEKHKARFGIIEDDA